MRITRPSKTLLMRFYRGLKFLADEEGLLAADVLSTDYMDKTQFRLFLEMEPVVHEVCHLVLLRADDPQYFRRVEAEISVEIDTYIWENLSDIASDRNEYQTLALELLFFRTYLWPYLWKDQTWMAETRIVTNAVPQFKVEMLKSKKYEYHRLTVERLIPKVEKHLQAVVDILRSGSTFDRSSADLPEDRRQDLLVAD